MRTPRTLFRLGLLVGLALTGVPPRPAEAYVDAGPTTLGSLCAMSHFITVVKIEKFSEEKRVIIYRKVSDLKGQYPREFIKHVLGPTHGAKSELLQRAQVGKTAILFSYNYGPNYDSYGGPEAKGGLVRSYTYIDRQLYICYVGNLDGGRCDDPRTLVQKYCGSPERLRAAVVEILAGREVVVPCVVNDAQGRPTIQRLRAGNRQMDYNPKRDFVGLGGDDFTRLEGMPGFAYQAPLTNLGAGAQGASVFDLEGNGEAHLAVFGASRVELLRNAGDSLLEMTVPGLPEGCRAAVWADYNGDGKPDLLLATTNGPRLFTNLGNGAFRDDTALLPSEPGCNITAAAWIDYDGNGRPDILLATGFHGLRLYRNLGKSEPVAAPPAPGGKPAVGRWFEDVSTQVGLGPNGIGGEAQGDTLNVCDVNGDGRPDFLYGAGSGMLFLNTTTGFALAKDCGIAYKPGKVGPVFGDFDNSGAPSLFVPQLDGRSKLFKNDGKGRFTDVTARALPGPMGMATSAAWGDLDSDGHLDLVVGCLRGANRYYRNRGDGTFEDATAAIGLDRRIFNTQAVLLADLNNDGVLDIVFVNEGQPTVALLGDATRTRPRTPVVLALTGATGLTGARLQVRDKMARPVAAWENLGGEGRGGQPGAQARFALPPGNYQVDVSLSSGGKRSHEITVGSSPLRATLSEK